MNEKLIQIIQKVIKEELEGEDNFKRFMSDSPKKSDVYVSGFNDKLGIERVKSFLYKSGYDFIVIKNELKIVKSPYKKDINRLLNNLKPFLKNAFGQLADSLEVKLK